MRLYCASRPLGGERRWGPKILIKGNYRDPLRSSKKKSVSTPGLRRLCAAVVIPLPWATRWWALPVMTVPLPSRKAAKKAGQRYRSRYRRTAQIMAQVRRWYRWRELVPQGEAKRSGGGRWSLLYGSSAAILSKEAHQCDYCHPFAP